MQTETKNTLSPFQASSDNDRYKEMVSAQVRRVTAELQKLEAILQAGMVDATDLKEFRKAVDQIRKTSWALQQKLDEPLEL